MIRIKYLLTIVSSVLLTSCGKSSQKLNGEHVSVGGKKDTVFFEKHDSIYIRKDSIEAIIKQLQC